MVAELQSALLAAVLAFGFTLAGWGLWSALPAMRRAPWIRSAGRLTVSLVMLTAVTAAGVASWPAFAPPVDRAAGPDSTLDTPPWLLGDERQRAGLTPWLLPDPDAAPAPPVVRSGRSDGEAVQPSDDRFLVGDLGDGSTGGSDGPSGTGGSTPPGSSDDGRPPSYQGPTAPSDDPSPDPAPSPTHSPSPDPSPEPSPEPTPSPDPEPEEPSEPCKGKSCIPCEDGPAPKPKPCVDLRVLDLSL